MYEKIAGMADNSKSPVNPIMRTNCKTAEAEPMGMDLWMSLLTALGTVPEEVSNLIDIVYIKTLMHYSYITSIVQNGNAVTLSVGDTSKYSSEKNSEADRRVFRRLAFLKQLAKNASANGGYIFRLMFEKAEMKNQKR